MWAWTGAVLALLGAAAASRAPRGYYSSEIYSMTERSHRRFAWLSVGFASIFIAGAFTPRIPAVPLLAAYLVAAILYGTSFVRGASEEED